METLQIKKDHAIQAYENANNKGKRLLSDLFGEKTFQKNVLERIKTIQDVLNDLSEDDPEVIEYRKLQNAGVAEYILANQEAVLIAKALNEDWAPNWSESNQYKYFPWFHMAAGSSASGFSCHDCDDWLTHSSVGSRLCFKSAELAKYAGTQFADVYKKFMLID